MMWKTAAQRVYFLYKRAVDEATRAQVRRVVQKMMKSSPFVNMSMPSNGEIDAMFPHGWSGGSWQEQFLASEWVKDFNEAKAAYKDFGAQSAPRSARRPAYTASEARRAYERYMHEADESSKAFRNVGLGSAAILAGLMGIAAGYTYYKNKQDAQNYKYYSR